MLIERKRLGKTFYEYSVFLSFTFFSSRKHIIKEYNYYFSDQIQLYYNNKHNKLYLAEL